MDKDELRLRELCDDEFLTKLREIVVLVGWTVDAVESVSFFNACAYYNDNNDIEALDYSDLMI